MKTCEWCGDPVVQGARRTRAFALPAEYGARKLYFHAQHFALFKTANPRIMKLKEREAVVGKVAASETI